jgi:hypothetical protein
MRAKAPVGDVDLDLVAEIEEKDIFEAARRRHEHESVALWRWAADVDDRADECLVLLILPEELRGGHRKG